MTTSIDPVSPEHGVTITQVAGPGEWTASAPDERSIDLYAESELQLRHERTERMIRLAEQQAV